MSQWGNLVEFWIQENDFTGTLGEWMGNWTNLQNFLAYDNDLWGPIPSWIGNWRSLRQLWLRTNAFTGTLPESMNQLFSLERLFIGQNAFSGTLPQWIGNAWPNLVDFDIHENSFFGELPDSISLWTALTQFDINGTPKMLEDRLWLSCSHLFLLLNQICYSLMFFDIAGLLILQTNAQQSMVSAVLFQD